MHLSSVFVWQEEHSDHGGGGDLVVEGLSVQVNKGGVHLDVIPEEQRAIERIFQKTGDSITFP